MIWYNDSEPFVAQWLRNLIAAGRLPAGDVDERPIQEVQPDDLKGYTQCHFFAGIGGWAYALKLAGWGDRPVWTGSCPCQPFSAAGKRQAHDDARHLWPSWFRLIRECRPERIFGEQVAGATGLGWLDVVSTDLEAEAYTIGAVVLGAHSVGAPHIRQRLYFVADAQYADRWSERQEHGDAHGRHGPGRSRIAGELDDAPGARRDSAGEGAEGEARDEARVRGSERRRTAGELADTDGGDASAEGLQRSWQHGQQPQDSGTHCAVGDATGERRTGGNESRQNVVRDGQQSAHAGPWDADWLPCRDGKARPVEPGTFPLAHGIPGRVGRLRAYGNSIVAQTAAEFVRAYMEVAA